MTLPATIGRYRVTGELGRGAMGVVYRGVDPSLDRPVAIKVIATRPGAVSASSQELEARFLREARVAARINHPGVVTVYDAGREGDSLYLVMELIEGESLAERLSRGQYPTQVEALNLVARVAEALAVAHNLGIIHRDVKPGNIMLTRDGGVKVADFGVAKAVGEETNLTRTGIVVGSPAYMAPEQVRGQELDGRADLFSLGVMLYELLMRRKPFPSETVTTLIYQILHEDPLAAEEPSRLLPEDLRAFLRRCLAKSTQDRVPDGQTMASEARALAARLTAGPPPAVVTAPVPVAPAVPPGSTAVPPPRVPPPPSAPPVPPPVARTDTRPAAATPASRTIITAAGPRPPAAVDVTSPTVMVKAQPPVPPVAPPAPAAPPATAPPPQPPGKPRRWAELIVALVGLGLLAVAVLVVLRGRRHPEPPVVVSEATPVVSPTAVVGTEPPSPTPQNPGEPTQPIPEVWATPTLVPTPWTWPTQASASPTVMVLHPSTPPPVVGVEPPTATPVPPTPTPTTPPIAAVFECQKAANFGVSPDAAEVTIDGKLLGIADDWDGFGGGPYEFPHPGTYLVKLSLAGYQTAWVQVVVKSSAEDEVVTVDTELEKEKKKK